MTCPNCQSPELPRVVARSGLGIWNPALIASLHCPACHFEWTEESPFGASVFQSKQAS